MITKQLAERLEDLFPAAEIVEAKDRVEVHRADWSEEKLRAALGMAALYEMRFSITTQFGQAAGVFLIPKQPPDPSASSRPGGIANALDE